MPDVAPEPAPRRTTAAAGRSREDARAEYERLMRAGGYNGNAEALVGRCTTLAAESGIDYYRHLQNLDNATHYPAAQVAYNERRGNGRRRLTPRTIRAWWDRDTAKEAPLWHSADTLTHLAELREAAACYPWPASIEYMSQRKNRATGKRQAKPEGVAGDTARRVYLAMVAHAIGTGSVFEVLLPAVDGAAPAAVWLGKGCALSDGASCRVLAELNRDGRGVAKDAAKAVALFARACELGEKAACTTTGTGTGTGAGTGTGTGATPG